MRVIGFVGPKGSGKDTAADLLRELKKAHGRISFAGPLKEICSKVFSIPSTLFHDPDLKERPFVELPSVGQDVVLTSSLLKQVKKECAARLPEYDITTGFMIYNIDRVSIAGLENQVMKSPRQLLQIIGTDLIRERVYKKWHLEAAFSETALAKLKGTVFCVTDVRFVNEYQFLKDKFGDDFTCYYVERPEKEAVLDEATHPSELGVREIKALLPEENILKNDGTMEDFKEKLDKLEIKPGVETKKSRFVYGIGER